MSDLSLIAQIDDLPPLRQVIADHGLQATKALGQNFLLDRNITDKIARLAGELSEHTVIEIGPGPGGLTRSLLRAGAGQVLAIEFDPRAVAALQALAKVAAGRLTVLQADALSVDIRTLVPQGPRMIIANLPYNIATPLVVGWLKQIRDDPVFVSRMLLMFQREVADRLTAPPGGKVYGRLGVLAQWLCEVKRAYDLPGSAFTPPPKVASSVVSFRPRVLAHDSPMAQSMEAITAAAFGQRRKMLRSSLGDYARLLEQSGIPGDLRAEQLPVSDFVKLAQALEA
ncbi:MAG: 16S rRNA (adenine(1518)-N(6)/adenine(1519)-N(6))-dimethyltransferase RsmA [Alphaproteobacteria bacterium]|nr:16S rRNA (adenine(1518)-N(6)/adenine(1519)-N(6))-dimethyltransferase RsmA [Alphaproteobacteria bacterium]